jgi:cell division protein FtsI (penicillin-binding protein 3)
MKRMMEGVVLRGTGVKAILDGYSSAGKTGTAQKVDPATGRYSKRNYIASFTGFAPVNNPAVTVLVILDSPLVGSHEGGIAAAPVFTRVMQQVLAYLNVPHDVDFQNEGRRRLLLRAQAREEDVSEGSPDHIAEETVSGDVSSSPAASSPAAAASANAGQDQVKPQIATAPAPVPLARPAPPASVPAPATRLVVVAAIRPRGTVVMNTGSSVTVPDFLGLPLRAALEEAESAGIELEVSGSGVGREQAPQAGASIAMGGRVRVRFGR